MDEPLSHQAAVWNVSTGALTVLPSIPGFHHADAYFVNDAGDVVGFAFRFPFRSAIFHWHQDRGLTVLTEDRLYQALDVASVESIEAIGLTETGVVLGRVTYVDDPAVDEFSLQRLFIWDPRTDGMIIGHDAARVVEGLINDRGIVVSQLDGGDTRVWRVGTGHVTPLNGPPGGAVGTITDIGDQGWVSGAVFTDSDLLDGRAAGLSDPLCKGGGLT